MTTTRVLVADDHRAFADALAALVGAEEDLIVVGVGTSAATALSLAESLRPDVLLLDVEFPDGDGIEVAERLRTTAPGVRVVVVSGHDDVATAAGAVRAGAIGFVTKEASSEELVGAVRSAAKGQAWVEARLLAGVLGELARGSAPRTPEQEKLDRLTQRERQVLECMVRGLDRGSIARTLFLSTNTVRTHSQRLLAKLEVHSTLEAVALALRAGLRPTAGPDVSAGASR